MQSFWRAYEKFYNCNIPKLIKNILHFCAIDKSTLSDINETTITEIEKIVNSNKSLLKNSSYALKTEKIMDKCIKCIIFLEKLLVVTDFAVYQRSSQEFKPSRYRVTHKLRRDTVTQYS